MLMDGQRLNHLLGLLVIEHVHYVRMPKCVWRYRDGEVYAIIIRPLYGGLQPVAHRFIGGGPEGFSQLLPFRGNPYADLMHIADVSKRHQAYRIFGGTPAAASHFLKQYANERLPCLQVCLKLPVRHSRPSVSKEIIKKKIRFSVGPF